MYILNLIVGMKKNLWDVCKSCSKLGLRINFVFRMPTQTSDWLDSELARMIYWLLLHTWGHTNADKSDLQCNLESCHSIVLMLQNTKFKTQSTLPAPGCFCSQGRTSTPWTMMHETKKSERSIKFAFIQGHKLLYKLFSL